MTTDGPRIGVHLPHPRGLVKALDHAASIGAEAVQIFADNPTAWRRRARPPRDLEAFRERTASRGVHPVAIHAAYLVNLAGSQRRFHDQSIDLLASDLRAGAGFGARFVNAHIGSHLGSGSDAAVAQVATAVERALAATDDVEGRPMIVLENSSGGGNGFGTSVDELAAVFAAIDARGVPRSAVGLCLDTAHLWGAGFALAEPGVVDGLFAALGRSIGLDRFVMVHFNDSKSELGSRSDRHEHVGAGRIGPVGLGAFIRHPAVRSAAVYLETPGMDDGWDAVNLARARDLLAGRPLEPLPAEAFDLPPRKGRRPAKSRTVSTAE